MNAVILSCTTLTDYVRAAQEKYGTDYPVVFADRNFHVEPSEMREHILEVLALAHGEACVVANQQRLLGNGNGVGFIIIAATADKGRAQKQGQGHESDFPVHCSFFVLCG